MEVGVLAKEIKVLGIIPARYKSSRFPGKPLEKINGIPMIKRTYDQAKKLKRLSDLIVATDHNKILRYCQSKDIPVVMTSDTCLTGTDRLAEVVNFATYNDYDLYINIQGDEPVIDPQAISQVISEYEKYGGQYIAYNLYKVIHDENEINNNAIIKVIVNKNNELMYMSRLSVPYSKNDFKPDYKQQIPIYGYTKDSLEIFSSNKKTLNEIHEDIELLRFIDLGLQIKMCETNANSISVDVPGDIYKVESFLNNLHGSR